MHCPQPPLDETPEQSWDAEPICRYDVGDVDCPSCCGCDRCETLDAPICADCRDYFKDLAADEKLHAARDEGW